MARFYDSPEWRRFRKRVLIERPMCETPGCRQASRHVDHKLALRAGGAPFDTANVSALCHSCHSRKTNLHDGGGGHALKPGQGGVAKGCGIDGMPYDPTHHWNADRGRGSKSSAGTESTSEANFFVQPRNKPWGFRKP